MNPDDSTKFISRYHELFFALYSILRNIKEHDTNENSNTYSTAGSSRNLAVLTWDACNDQILTSENYPLILSHKSEADDGLASLPLNLKNKVKRIGDDSTVKSLQSLISILKDNSVWKLWTGSEESFSCTGRLHSLEVAMQTYETNKRFTKCLKRLYLAELISQAGHDEEHTFQNDFPARKRRKKNGTALRLEVVSNVKDIIHVNDMNDSVASTENAKEKEKWICKVTKTKPGSWKRLGEAWNLMFSKFGIGLSLVLPEDFSDEE